MPRYNREPSSEFVQKVYCPSVGTWSIPSNTATQSFLKLLSSPTPGHGASLDLKSIAETVAVTEAALPSIAATAWSRLRRCGTPAQNRAWKPAAVVGGTVGLGCGVGAGFGVGRAVGVGFGVGRAVGVGDMVGGVGPDTPFGEL